MRRTVRLHATITRFIASRWFFRIVLMVFVAEASWLAITSAFPMAFDEGYHFGLIQFFAHHLNPIVTSQPASTYNLGNIMHNPSWLYHYLLSFPYRLVAHFTASLQTQVVSLRLINVGIAVLSLLMLRKLLGRLGLPAVISNLVLFLFALTPVVTALSAQINYDNLVILGSLGAAYLTVRCLETIRAGKPDAALLLGLLCVCLYGSLVKYSFLPIFVGITMVIGWQAARRLLHDPRGNLHVLWISVRNLGKLKLTTLLVIAGIGVSLFVATYGVNLVRYHNPVPQCNQVLTIADCSQYYAWDRNYVLAENRHTTPPASSVFSYTYHWTVTVWYSLYAEIIPTGGIVHIAHGFYVILLALTVFAAICTLGQLRRIFSTYHSLLVLTLVAAVYVLFLWSRNYHDYRQLGQAVAVQGRYFVPVLMYLYVLLVLGVYYTLRNRRSFGHVVQATAVLLAIVSFSYYGGYVRYSSQVTPTNGWPAGRNLAAAVGSKAR